MDQASSSKLPKYLRALLVTLAVLGTTLGAAACSPSQHKHHHTKIFGY